MMLSRELLFFISTLGWFNGLILSGYFLFFNKNGSPSTRLLGLMILALSIRVAKSVLWWFFPELPVIVVQIGITVCLFIGPLLYYYLQASSRGLIELLRLWKIVLLGYLVLSVILLVFFTTLADIPYWRKFIIPAIYLQWFLYVLFSGRIVWSKIKSLFDSTVKFTANDKWQLAVYLGSLVIVIGYALSFMGIKQTPYITGPIIFSSMIYLNILILANSKKAELVIQSETERYAKKKLDAELVKEKIPMLEALMQEKLVYTNPELKLVELAGMLSLSAHQLSQLLNDHLGKTFNSYINDYRIIKACEIITSNQNLKLEAVGYEVGFNSKSSFFTAFKRYTGKTPKSYKEHLT